MVVVDRAGRIVLLNLQTEKLFGYRRDELVGKPVTAIVPGGLAEPPTPQIGSGMELVGRRKDGTEFSIEVMQSHLATADGVLATASIRDISLRRKAEALLKGKKRKAAEVADAHLAQMEARYRGLLEAAPDAMVVVNQAGKIVLFNLQAEKQFGYQRDELLGQPVTNIIPKGFAERLIADDLRSAADAVAQQIETGIELIGLRKDGTEFPIEIMLSPLESADGILVTAAIRNISKRKEAEGQLLQAQKLESIGRLAGGIAHDFNNMLFVIHGYAELLTEDLAPKNRVRLDPGDALLSVIAITDAADRATVLTGQLLAFSRQQVIKPRVLDLNLAIADLAPMMRQLIGENMQLVVRPGQDASNILGDPGQLDQVIVNLVVNARDAMPNGGTVTIETRNAAVDEPYALSHFGVKPGPFLLLSVTDTGIGMDLATRERIFEPFFTTKQLGKGTGLGLATTYGIVRQAGGFIWVYSEPGMGSSFKLYFPRVDAPASSIVPRIATAPAVGTGTVLVVEDERAVREMTTLLLTRAGYTVVAVASAAEAMTRLEKLASIVEVLITDVIMPATSGITLAEWAMDRFPQIGIVLLSGYTAGTVDVDKVTARGAAFVSKPVTSGQLLLAVQQSRGLRRVDPAPEVEPA
jgi:PAS domain S-box-containing protein